MVTHPTFLFLDENYHWLKESMLMIHPTFLFQMKWFPQPPPSAAADKGYSQLAPGKCAKPECPLVGQKHFHCTRTECNFATESPDMLHDHKSNEKLIFDSFRQFSRKLDCRRPGCKYNLLHKHYHCMHQGCQFSFLQVNSHWISLPNYEKVIVLSILFVVVWIF